MDYLTPVNLKGSSRRRSIGGLSVSKVKPHYREITEDGMKYKITEDGQLTHRPPPSPEKKKKKVKRSPPPPPPPPPPLRHLGNFFLALEK